MGRSVKSARPLKGVTVLDISRLLPGGFASLLLKQLGARVIKVEQPGVGDYYRALTSKEKRLGGNQVDVLNHGKESLGLDLKSEDGRRVFIKLLSRVDVVIESFRPHALKKLGLPYSTLKRKHPRLILCSITGFGQRGSLARLGGHDLNFLGLSGLLSKLLDDRGNCVIPDFQVADLSAGFLAALRIAAVLFERRRTRIGTWIDGSLMEGAMAIARLYPPRGRSFLGGGLLRYGVYETADKGAITLAPLEGKFWERFCHLIGRSQWYEGDSNLQLDDKKKREELKEIFKQKNLEEWTRLGQEHDLCLFPVKEPQAPVGNRVFSPLGRHTSQILRSVGYKDGEIQRLRSQGVIA